MKLLITTFVSCLVSIQISDSGIPPVVGQSYNLTCSVSINVTNYTWSSTVGPLDNDKQILVLPMLSLSDAGKYTCEVQILGSMTYIANSSYTLFLQCK